MENKATLSSYDNETVDGGRWDNDTDADDNDDDDDNDHLYFSNTTAHVRALILTCLVLFSLFTMVSNGLVIVSVAKIRRLQTAANITIVNLACYDFVVGAVLWTAVLPRDTRLRCVVFTGYGVFNIVSSMAGMALCTINRYTAISYPLRYPLLMTPARTGWLIAACITYAMLMSVGGMIQVALRWRPSALCIPGRMMTRAYAYYVFSHYLVLFVLMSYCYGVIARIAWTHTKRMATASNEERQEMSAFHATLKMSKIILTVVGTSWTLLGPHMLYMCLLLAYPNSGNEWWLQALRVIRINGLILNSFLNPIVYFYKFMDFRLAVRELFGCKKPSVAPLP
ncbi:PREDICTED: histamine H2 receptor-like [Priapulus caudatus]|uniref:Histamine H2 receptor-like n=1 Tax=Priapulus caudatus TaxID=37621 RepID=A0ABM1ES50_PRICU|nr:PREDICTED: histamine H2 receptor-like [Priapulus caudatus]